MVNWKFRAADSPAYFDNSITNYKRDNNYEDFDFVKKDFDYDFMKRNFLYRPLRPNTKQRRTLSLFDY